MGVLQRMCLDLRYNSKIMQKRFRNIAILIVCIALIGFSPFLAHAQLSLPGFTGMSVFTFPCTCSLSLWGFFAPLYITSFPLAGPMVYVPWATIPFLNFLPTIPLTTNVGAYIPAVQACWFYVPPVFCVPIPAVGMMLYVGTSLPGGVI